MVGPMWVWECVLTFLLQFSFPKPALSSLPPQPHGHDHHSPLLLLNDNQPALHQCPSYLLSLTKPPAPAVLFCWVTQIGLVCFSYPLRWYKHAAIASLLADYEGKKMWLQVAIWYNLKIMIGGVKSALELEEEKMMSWYYFIHLKPHYVVHIT